MEKESADREERTMGVRACIPTNKQSDGGGRARGDREAAVGIETLRLTYVIWTESGVGQCLCCNNRG